MYPIVVALLIIHSFWMYYDIAITSHQRHRPKRKPIRVTESSPLSPYYPPSPGMEYHGYTRAFPVWDHPFPCGHLESEQAMRTRAPATEGLFYVRLVEASSSICSSVTARIARNAARRQQQKEQSNHGSNNITRVCTTRLVSQRARRFSDRLPLKSFLWSVVREPVDRLVSKYNHFDRRDIRRTTTSNFQNFVLNNERQDYGYYFRSLNVDRYLNPYNKEHEAHTQEVLESYDFLGIAERMDESLVVLKFILNLEIEDLLYLSAPKANGTTTTRGGSSSNIDYYENWKKEECRPILTPEVTLEMKEWFHSEEFEAFIEADVLLYKAANASLDKTISEIGRERVEKTVQQLRWAQRQVEEKCRHVRFPCSSQGEYQKETDCFLSDIGCGHNCIDTLVGTFRNDDFTSAPA